MDKKDIYEHLANIYLDASSKRKDKIQEKNKLRNLFPWVTFFLLGVAFILIISQNKPSLVNYKDKVSSEVAFILQDNIVKMNFHFNPMKREEYSIKLNNLNLRQFKTVAFSVRKAKFNDKIILKVEFASSAKETSGIYLGNLKAYKWEDYKIPLTLFKDISNWSQMEGLSFIVEEEAASQDHDIVYIDNIRLLR